MTEDSVSSIRAALESAVKDLLLECSSRPILGADVRGAFPPLSLGANLRRPTFIVVPDTNYLLRDVANACKHGRRVLVTAANIGGIRIFCAPHVVREVYAKSAKWAARIGVSVETYVSRWENEYLPLFRLIEKPEALVASFTPLEQTRLEMLRSLDVDDIPSATIAIALNGFYLTWDKDPFAAAYGRKPDEQELKDQILVLMDGGKTTAMAEMFALMLLLPTAVISALGSAYRELAKAVPWAPWLLLASAVVLAMRISPERLRQFGLTTISALEVFGALYQPYQEALDRFTNSGPGEPEWPRLSKHAERQAVLRRAVSYSLARTAGLTSARQLAHDLPSLAVGQGEKLVRETLRAWSGFVQPRPGQFQLGTPVPPDFRAGAPSQREGK